MHEFEQLKQLVLDGEYDEESKKQVAELEARLTTALMAEKLHEHHVIQDYIKHLTLQSANCTRLLSQDRTLTELERLHLFDKRDLCDHFTQLFTGEGKQAIEEEIKSLLDAAKTS